MGEIIAFFLRDLAIVHSSANSPKECDMKNAEFANREIFVHNCIVILIVVMHRVLAHFQYEMAAVIA